MDEARNEHVDGSEQEETNSSMTLSLKKMKIDVSLNLMEEMQTYKSKVLTINYLLLKRMYLFILTSYIDGI